MFGTRLGHVFRSAQRVPGKAIITTITTPAFLLLVPVVGSNNSTSTSSTCPPSHNTLLPSPTPPPVPHRFSVRYFLLRCRRCGTVPRIPHRRQTQFHQSQRRNYLPRWQCFHHGHQRRSSPFKCDGRKRRWARQRRPRTVFGGWERERTEFQHQRPPRNHAPSNLRCGRRYSNV